ncbi:MAG: type IV secretion system protein [Deltaproteobacteria bacterium]|jgi:type IV secretion system protein VirB6|nr:type IV secretion system protein [Deltaproteobacteria bacterium]
MATQAKYYAEIMQAVDTTTSKYISQGVQQIIDAISTPAFALMGLYVVLWGFAHFMGLIKEPITDGVKRFLKVAAIIVLALHFGTYNDYIAKVFTKEPEQLGIALIKNTGGASGINSATSLVDVIDGIFNDIWDLGQKYWKAASADTIPSIGGYLAGAVIMVLAVCVSAYSAFLVVLAKAFMAVLIALGPLFIISIMFEATRKFFESWMGLICNYSLVLILVMAVNGFLVTTLQTYLTTALAGDGENVALLAPVAALGVISCFVLAQVLSVASALGGGVALSTMGAASWAVGKITSPAKAAAGAGAKAGAKAAGAGAVKLVKRSWRPSTASKG